MSDDDETESEQEEDDEDMDAQPPQPGWYFVDPNINREARYDTKEDAQQAWRVWLSGLRGRKPRYEAYVTYFDGTDSGSDDDSGNESSGYDTDDGPQDDLESLTDPQDQTLFRRVISDFFPGIDETIRIGSRPTPRDWNTYIKRLRETPFGGRHDYYRNRVTQIFQMLQERREERRSTVQRRRSRTRQRRQ